MSTPSAKRRRLEDAQSALRKPFRSPFKTPSRKLELEKPNADITASSTAVPSPLVQTTRPDSSADQSFSVSSLRTLRNSRSSTTLSTPSKPRPFVRDTAAPDDPLTAAILAEKQKQAVLNRQIQSIRSELDTLSQALAIATSTKDAELEALTRKWRDATRAAAEEVFADTRDRVNNMGGIGVWRKNAQRQQEWRQGFYAQEEDQPNLDESEDEDQEENEELTPEEREAKLVAREQRAEARAEAKKERRWQEDQAAEAEAQKPSSTDDGGNEDSFTMDMMLETLNIDPEMIGWDKEGQRWVD
ncbi:hypothetical protein MPH_04584 [Macrophomina phaseolina MS6]|uniref:DNA repair protein Dds20/Mei5 n=1 Tax=Macrophomina phaseolina (strain MS6) TaxID=1126212 RepID=K2SN30_MACPH|nr:hypothetical protein MPH_04584 [Macrophomina phaseolina MS6]